MNNNLHYKTCLDALDNYYTGLFNDANIDGMVNYINSCNINKVLNDQEEINVFKVAVGNSIDDKVLNKGIYLIKLFLQFNYSS